jgi:hypothetical protein
MLARNATDDQTSFVDVEARGCHLRTQRHATSNTYCFSKLTLLDTFFLASLRSPNELDPVARYAH